MYVEFERMRDGFDKVHVHEAPSNFILHRLTKPEHEFHDHPFDLDIIVLEGSYVEEVVEFYGSRWHVRTITRYQGDRFTIAHDHVHRLIGFPQGSALTMATYGPFVRKSGFWELRGLDGAYRRVHDEATWEKQSD